MRDQNGDEQLIAWIKRGDEGVIEVFGDGTPHIGMAGNVLSVYVKWTKQGYRSHVHPEDLERVDPKKSWLQRLKKWWDNMWSASGKTKSPPRKGRGTTNAQQ